MHTQITMCTYVAFKMSSQAKLLTISSDRSNAYQENTFHNSIVTVAMQNSGRT